VSGRRGGRHAPGNDRSGAENFGLLFRELFFGQDALLDKFAKLLQPHD
jgi:hypothetical protein